MRPKLFRLLLAERQAALGISLANLQQAPAEETLQELRIDLHRLRTLLRPLGGRRAFAPLLRHAGRALEVTRPLRELDLLAEDLEQHDHGKAALLRRRQFHRELPALLATAPLRVLEEHCQPSSESSPAIALPDRDALDKRCRKIVGRDLERLRRHMDAKKIDLHELRLDIRRLRYQLEIEEFPGIEKELKLLARTQDLLGDWQDRTRWLAQAEYEKDLQPCRARWQGEQAALATRLPELVGRLRLLLGQAG